MRQILVGCGHLGRMRPVIAALLTGLSACSFTFSPHHAWNHRAAYGLADRSSCEVLRIDSPDEATQTSLKLTGTNRGGTFRVLLFDPDGRTRADETLKAGEHRTELSWPAVAGVWKCVLRFEGFSGDYCLDLAAADEPLHVQIDVTGIEFRDAK